MTSMNDTDDEPKKCSTQNTAVEETTTVTVEDGDETIQGEEKWALVQVYSADELLAKKAVKCMTSRCKLLACCKYVTEDYGKEWSTCLDCQKRDFDGWPDDTSEIPMKFLTKEHRDVLMKKCTKSKTIDFPPLPPCNDGEESSGRDEDNASQEEMKTTTIEPTEIADSGTQDHENTVSDNREEEEDDDDEESEKEEAWDLKHIFTIEELSHTSPKMCMTKKCPLVACSTYVSNIDDTNVWYTCIDCQEKDYGGWPDSNELPIQFMTDEHRQIIIEKCTGRYSPDMPDIATSISSASSTKSSQSSPVVKCTRVQNDDHIDPISLTSPPPGKLTSSKTQAMRNAACTAVTPSPVPTGPSKHALAIHKKWQDVAKSLGGERIVVNKSDAKKLIFDMLNDSFSPMNITDIFKKLHGVVPSPVLKSCLDDMALDNYENPFDQSDDDDDDGDGGNKKKKAKRSSPDGIGDEYAGTLSIKPGRNANTTLYYVNQKKCFNNGDGMLPDDKNALLSDHEALKAEKDVLSRSISNAVIETTKLLSEPTNTNLEVQLEEEEKTAQTLKENLESSRGLKANEKQRLLTKRKIESMSTHWRQRKRICIDFLINMEENTDGTISMKKCLAGDGQIECDSDEAAIKNAIAFSKRKKPKVLHNKKNQIGSRKPSVIPDELFIGVMLHTSGNIERVYLHDDDAK